MEELLECAVCMEVFKTSGDKMPKMLPCQHSFCVQCLKNIIGPQGSITCPACRKQHCTQRIDVLPNSLTLIHLLDCTSRKFHSKCQKCLKIRSSVKTYCQKCLDDHVDNKLIEAIDNAESFESQNDDDAPSVEDSRSSESDDSSENDGTDSIIRAVQTSIPSRMDDEWNVLHISLLVLAFLIFQMIMYLLIDYVLKYFDIDHFNVIRLLFWQLFAIFIDIFRYLRGILTFTFSQLYQTLDVIYEIALSVPSKTYILLHSTIIHIYEISMTLSCYIATVLRGVYIVFQSFFSFFTSSIRFVYEAVYIDIIEIFSNMIEQFKRALSYVYAWIEVNYQSIYLDLKNGLVIVASSVYGVLSILLCSICSFLVLICTTYLPNFMLITLSTVGLLYDIAVNVLCQIYQLVVEALIHALPYIYEALQSMYGIISVLIGFVPILCSSIFDVFCCYIPILFSHCSSLASLIITCLSDVSYMLYCLTYSVAFHFLPRFISVISSMLQTILTVFQHLLSPIFAVISPQFEFLFQ